MKREKLKNLLKPYYKEKSEMPGLVVNGKRKPSYQIMYKLNKQENIPFTVWHDVTKWLKEESKEQGETKPLVDKAS